MFGETAVSQTVVWVGLGVILFVILLFAIREVVCWYYKINDLKKGIADLRIALYAMAKDKLKECAGLNCNALNLIDAEKCDACGAQFKENTSQESAD